CGGRGEDVLRDPPPLAAHAFHTPSDLDRAVRADGKIGHQPFDPHEDVFAEGAQLLACGGTSERGDETVKQDAVSLEEPEPLERGRIVEAEYLGEREPFLGAGELGTVRLIKHE